VTRSTTGMAVTDDAFLGDGLTILQPTAGYRAGVDAVLLAASVPAAATAFNVLDAGAGAGVVGLCVARRLEGARVTLLERETQLAELARDNVSRNGLADRVRVVCGDVCGRASDLQSAGLHDETFDAVLANPPFHVTAHGTPASAPLKAVSHAMERGGLDHWVRFAARMARPGGSLTLIHKADALAEILAAFARRFGGVKVKPVYARAGEPAIRVIVRGVKGSRAPLDIGAPLVLHGEAGHGFTGEVDAILRNGAALAI
jgi:tRNA1(Val) A37 N6-methylase TrmN6